MRDIFPHSAAARPARNRFTSPIKVAAAVVPLLAIYSGLAQAELPAEVYDSSRSYPGGSYVCYQQDLFKAQWWAGAGDTPEAVYTATNSWESPWVLDTAGACDTSGTGNLPPTAAAVATPAEITGAGSIALDGSQSMDPDGVALSYTWAQIAPSTPLANIQAADAASTQIDLPSVSADTTYEFRLTVSDGELSAQTTVNVLQRVETTGHNQAPVAAASASQANVSCPASVTLIGTNSSDPDGDALVVQWQQMSGPQAVIATPNTLQTTVDLPDTGADTAYIFELHVSDGELSDAALVAIDQQCGDAGFTLPISTLEAREAELTSSELFTQVKASIATRDNDAVEAVVPGRALNPANVLRVESLIKNADWEYLFPLRAEEYSYTKFLRAVAKFPAFCGDYNDGRDALAICRKSLATMFAHFTQETGGHTPHWEQPEWRQGLYFIREQGWTESMPNGYGICDPSTWQAQQWPCATFADGSHKSYFGRGAKQLSYNYNYGPFSAAMFGDVSVLLEQPELVADTWLNLASAVFFFVYPQPPKPSMLHVIDGTWQPNAQDQASGLVPGFGVTTMVINGGIECGGTNEHAQSLNRIDYYRNFADYLAVPVASSEVLGCAGMDRFAVGGAGAMDIYWEQDWSWDPQYPNGQSYACKLVGYQTRFSAFVEGDYARCVDHFFDVNIDYSR